MEGRMEEEGSEDSEREGQVRVRGIENGRQRKRVTESERVKE
jgi:hypothetical protein